MSITQIQLSTLYSHIGKPHEQSIKMSTDTTVYVEDRGDDGIQIMEDGFITHDNIDKMKFTFSSPQDITNSVYKKGNRNRSDIAVTNNGRIGYCSMTCHYPNNRDTSSKVMLTDCVVQYREGIERENSNYAKGFVSVGVPVDYINKITKDARLNSSVNLTVKDKVQKIDGCYWLDCTLDNLSQADTWVIYEDKDGNDTGGRGSIYDILKGMKSSVTADIMMTCSGSITTEKMEEKLDLENGRFTVTMKPTEMFVKDVSKKVGPVLTDTNKRRKEVADKSERFKASSVLAEFAMRNLHL